MKRYGLLLVVSALLVLIGASASLAIFPTSPDGKITLNLQQGWIDCTQAWFICTDTNDINTACSQFVKPGQTLNLAPKLSSTINHGAKTVYIITNPPCTQGPVFDEAPGDEDYTGKWQITYVTFKPKAERHNVCNTDPFDEDDNPGGLPAKKDAIFDKTKIVVDYPIVAIGQLGAPGPINNGRANRENFQIKEAININFKNKTITLPTYNAYCTDPLTRRVMIVRFIITAANAPLEADRLGVIFTPELGLVPVKDTMKGWIFGIWGPTTPTQFPVLTACPTPLGCKNSNFDYSPVIELPFILPGGRPPCAVLTNPTVIEQLIHNGVLHLDGTVRFNGSVVGYL